MSDTAHELLREALPCVEECRDEERVKAMRYEGYESRAERYEATAREHDDLIARIRSFLPDGDRP